MATFQAPANLKDFDLGSDPAALRASWHKTINDQVNFRIASRPAFYNPLSPPAPTAPAFAAPQWTGLPRTVKRLIPGSIADAASAVENAIMMGGPDPIEGPRFTPPFRDATTGETFNGPAYRPQDEYLEWVTRRDASGVITEIIFTCEGPEYWDTIAEDRGLLLKLYKDLSGNTSIQPEDLVFPKKLTWENPNDGVQTFEAGSYNPYNKWNMEYAIHLTQPANTLGAEITLAKDASRLFGNPTPVTVDPDLICCAAYGGINRMSDPTIGLAVNTQVRSGKRVSLRNPIGLYMRGILPNDLTKFALPNNMPFTAAQKCFEILRPLPADVTDMIVRARFRVPDGTLHGGVQLRVGDLKVNGEKITTGGQVADLITMTLFAQAIPGAPVQQAAACRFRPCHDVNHPEIIVPIAFGSQCPDLGISPQIANIELAKTANFDSMTPDVLEEPAGAKSRTRYAINRARR